MRFRSLLLIVMVAMSVLAAVPAVAQSGTSAPPPVADGWTRYQYGPYTSAGDNAGGTATFPYQAPPSPTGEFVIYARADYADAQWRVREADTKTDYDYLASGTEATIRGSYAANTEYWVDVTMLTDAVYTMYIDVPASTQPPTRPTVDVDRVWGSTRYATAAAVASTAFPNGANEAFLVDGETFPDALATAYAAGQLRSPILMTTGSEVPRATLNSLSALRVSRVYVVGGQTRIPESIVTELETAGYTVERTAGESRYATAAAVATTYRRQIGVIGGQRAAFIASGESFADALAAGPLAYGVNLPMLLSRPDDVPAETLEALQDMDIRRVVLVGGTGALSNDVAAQLSANGLLVDRIAGQTRTETAALVARFAVDELGLDIDEVLIANGAAFPDALTASTLGGERYIPLILSANPDSLGTDATDWLGDGCDLTKLFVIGGTGAISNEVSETAQTAAGC